MLVMTDDQGWAQVGFHGNPYIRTPTLDRLAAESTEFTQFYVEPKCAPTRAALLTGVHGYRNGVIDTHLGRTFLDPAAVTLAEEQSEGTLNIYKKDNDLFGDHSPWDRLIERLSGTKRRPLIIVYDEGHNLSEQQTDLLSELEPDAYLLASATLRLPANFQQSVIQPIKLWVDESENPATLARFRESQRRSMAPPLSQKGAAATRRCAPPRSAAAAATCSAIGRSRLWRRRISPFPARPCTDRRKSAAIAAQCAAAPWRTRVFPEIRSKKSAVSAIASAAKPASRCSRTSQLPPHPPKVRFPEPTSTWHSEVKTDTFGWNTPLVTATGSIS